MRLSEAAKSTAGCVALLLVVTVLFYWKILLTHQFSLLTAAEGVNQGYSWYQFWVASIRRGVLPLWDPYAFSGRSFAGEMLAQAFFPLNFALALVPLNQAGLLSPQLYNVFFSLAHFLAACFMFWLARELGLTRFAAMIGAVCFAFGGYVGGVPWPNYLWSSIWLPVTFIFVMRAGKTGAAKMAILNALTAGLALGMSILAGGLHPAIMQTIVIVTALGFSVLHRQRDDARREQAWLYPAAVLGVIGLVAFAAGAVQLLPSIEYSRLSVRWIGTPGALPATQKIPYAYLQDGVAPQGVLTFLIPAAFNGKVGTGEVPIPYLGVFPILLAVIGVWKTWRNLWVRYLAGLAVGAFVFSLGSFSLLHGLLYAIVPFLWVAREAGRFLYLSDFALAVLAAFGADALYCRTLESGDTWVSLNRFLKWVAILCALALCIPAVFTQAETTALNVLSLLMILSSCALFFYVSRGHAGRGARFITLALILSDLSAFDLSSRNKIEVARTGTNHLDRLLSCRGAVDFLKSKNDLFRVQVLADAAPNIGDVFGIQTTWGGGPTAIMHYLDFINSVSSAVDLLNVRYFMKPATATEPGAVYQDAAWKLYENPRAYPRAWLVHEVVVEPARQALLNRLRSPETDPHHVAVLSEPVAGGLAPATGAGLEGVKFNSYEANRLDLTVHAESRALLVLSEMYYPGWKANVNDHPAEIHEVDGALRAILVERGVSQITLRYMPVSILAGALLTISAFLSTLLFALYCRKARHPHFESESERPSVAVKARGSAATLE